MRDARKDLGYQENERVRKINSRLVSNRYTDGFPRGTFVSFYLKRECVERSAVRLLSSRLYRACCQIAFVLLKAYDECRIWQPARQMIAFMGKLL